MDEYGNAEVYGIVIIWSKFCAIFMPSLIHAFLFPPLPSNLSEARFHEICNPYCALLCQLLNNAYFLKYMTSKHPIAAQGKRLAHVQANRMMFLAETWDRGLHDPREAVASYYHHIIVKMSEVLNFSLAYLEGDPASVPVDPAVSSRLLPYLDRWKVRLGPMAGGEDSCESAAGILRRENKWIGATQTIRETMSPNMQGCALPACGIKDNLRTCGR